MDVPFIIRHTPRAIVVFPCVANQVDVTVLAHLIKVLAGPEAGHHEVGDSLWLETDKVLDDGGVLHRGATLLQHNPVVVWNIEELPDLCLGVIGDVDELLLSVTEFHDRLAGTAEVVQLFTDFVEDGFWETTWSSGEVVCLATIRFDLLGLERLAILVRVHLCLIQILYKIIEILKTLQIKFIKCAIAYKYFMIKT